MGDKSEPAHHDFDVEHILSQLDLDEKVGLVSGKDFWHTYPVPRLGVPSIRVTDGPNGVRGTRFFNSVPAACFPCGTGLAATWDVDLIEQGGQLQGREAISKGASVILGPTTNMQRSPLGGRGFESFSEDPVLAGNMSAATIKGIQSTGVAATIKHYVCNDQEDHRQAVDSILSERALREIYLKPFQIAERDSKPMCYMTAYNKVNGIHVSENRRLLQTILREEWGFNGLIMSDWFGTYSTTDAIKAGLDLEMPGKTYVRGQLVNYAVSSGKLLPVELDARVREVLKLVQKLLPLGIPENAPEGTNDTKETAAALRQVTNSSLVLLKNENNTLPFSRQKTTAVIGSNGNFAAYCGGGSAGITPYYAVTPLDGVRAQVPDVKFALGVPGWKKLPLLDRMTKTKDGKVGLTMKIYLDPPSKTDREVLDEIYVKIADCTLGDLNHPRIPGDLWYADFEATFTPGETCEYEFGLSVAGTAKLYVDGQLVVDNETKQHPGESFFGSGTREEVGSVRLEKGQTYDILVRFATMPTQTFKTPGATAMGAGGIRMGGERKIERKSELERAVALAKEVDQVIICTGLNSDWESEGWDRAHMDLPAGSDDMVRAVCAANPHTAVVVQSGTPVTMPWAREASALIQAWYGGNETGNAIADVVFGNFNPSGKLSLSFPIRNEDNPAFLNYKSERGRTTYGEGVYVGYRFYEKTKKEVAFPFGHGLSYTTFDMTSLSVNVDDEGKGNASDPQIRVQVSVTNTGRVDGAQVVQVYVAQASPTVNRPVKELKGFTKVFVTAGQTVQAEVGFSKKHATSFWDEERDAWISERDQYTILVGDSSANTPLKADFEVKKTTWWKGL